MSPKRISLFIFLSLCILLILMFFSNSIIVSGNRQETGFKIADFFIKYPNTSAFLYEDKPVINQKADSLIQIADSIIHIIGEDVMDADFKPHIPDFSKIDTASIVRIAYPAHPIAKPDQTSGAPLIENLVSHLESGSCRILHYGDSQLEGDRITGYLRNRLQGVYGGSGPGFIPVKQVYNQLAADITVSENWYRFAIFDPTQKITPEKDYGLYASFSRFTAKGASDHDSLSVENLFTTRATITIKPSAKSYGRLKKYNLIRLHYGNAAYPVKVRIFHNGNLFSESSLIADKAYHCFEISTDATPAELTIELEGKVSPDFYGITLDADAGVSVDNIAMRGGSGTIFSKMNPPGFRSMAQLLDPDVLIFQFGGNTIPYVKDSASINDYARYLMGNIKWVKRNIPGSVIMFIGPSDMSTMVNGEMVTYPLLPYLDKTLKAACLANGIAYWSMFEAMGGLNSMKYWVEKGLAASDYTHFSPAGTRIISELFFTALYLDLKAVSNQQSAVSSQQSAISSQQSAISNQQSAVSRQQSAFSSQQSAQSEGQTVN